MPKTLTRVITLFFLFFLLMGVQVTSQHQSALAQDGLPPEEIPADFIEGLDEPAPDFVPGMVLVGLRGDVVTSASMDVNSWGEIEVLAVEPLSLPYSDAKAVNSEDVAPESSPDQATGQSSGQYNGPMVGYKLTVPEGAEWGTIEALLARDDVVFAEPNWLLHIAQSAPDKATLETPFVMADTLYHDQWYLQRIGMSRAWSLALQESEGDLNTVEVFVIDTGVDFNHPDLTDILASGRNYITTTLAPNDDFGHGTHIAGLVAAAANGTGMVGSGLAVEITPYKALDANGTGRLDRIAQAIEDATDSGADIINLSLETISNSDTLRTAVEYAADEGVLVIAASGNSGRTSVSYPAAYPDVLAVGGTTYFDVRAYYSNRGTALDLVAPGGVPGNAIMSTWPRAVAIKCPSGLREVNGGLYCDNFGTSMATGIVSGVAALIMGMRNLDAEEVREILLESAAPIAGTSNEVGNGRLDAVQAVRMALEPRLVYDEENTFVSAMKGDAAFSVKVPLTNPSLTPLHIEVTPTISTTWYTLVGPRQGEVSYDDPLEIQLLYTPTTVSVGTQQSSLRVTATVEGGGTSVYIINIGLHIYPSAVGEEELYVPIAKAVPEGFRWYEPSFTERVNYTIGNDSNIVVDLPFTMSLYGRIYSDLRVFADGFAVAPAASFLSNLPNECLANQTSPSFSIFGWWSSLSLAGDSALSTFQPDPTRFVIEYDNFVTMGSSDPDDRVTFQMVLNSNGILELNYEGTPEHTPPSLTVGASAEEGRFYNQITCHLGDSMRVGEVPQPYQSFVFLLGDLY